MNGFHLCILFTVLVSGILFVCPNELNHWALTQFMFRCLINSCNSLFVLLLQIPLASLVGPDIFLIIFLSNTESRDARRITAAEMKYMRRTAGYTWTDYKTNSHIAKELEITPVLDKMLEYKRNWIQHVNRMPRDRLPRIMKHYSPTGRRNRGRPLKRLLDT